jgi:adhesin transport system outer membrane protein
LIITTNPIVCNGSFAGAERLLFYNVSILKDISCKSATNEEDGKMRSFFKCVAIVGVGVLLLGGGSAQGETLQNEIKYVLQTNPEIKASSYNRLAKDQAVIQAKGGYFPTLDASLSTGIDYQMHTVASDPNITRPKSTILSLRQNVFQFGATQSEVRRMEASAQSQAYLLQGTSENVALQASRVYLNLLRNMELYELAKENLVNHERIGDQMKLRSTSGVDRKADLDQVMGRLALAQSNVVVTTANIADGKTDYQAVIGRLPENLVKPPSMDSTIPGSMDEAEQLAVKNYPILKSARADLEARKAQYETAKRVNYPRLDLAVDYKWQTDVDYPHRQEDLLANAVLSFNIFNGLRNKARIAETLHQISEANEILNNTQRQVVQSVRLSWEAYTAAKERVTALEEYVKSTGLTNEAFGAQWNIGRRTMFDVLDTQAEYITAKSSLVSAQYDKMYAEYRVLSGMAKLVETLGLQWPDESRVNTTLTELFPLPGGDGSAPVAAPQVSPVKSDDSFMKADKDGFMKADKDGFIKAPQPPAALQVSEPVKKAVPAPAAPQVSEPVKKVEPASEKTSDGFMKADKDGFMKADKDGFIKSK